MAPLRGAQAEGARPPAGVPRNHRGSDPRGPRRAPPDRRGPGPGPGDAADHRPALRLRGLAAVVAQDPAAAFGRPGAERGRAADRRARAAADGLRVGHLLGPAGHVRQATGGAVVPGRAGLGRRPARSRPAAISTRPRASSRTPRCCCWTSARPANCIERLRRGRVPRGQPRGQALHVAAVSAVHHQHAAAGGQPQVRLHRPAHDAGGPEPLRERPHHLHADRLDQPGLGGGRGRPASWSPRSTARSICPTSRGSTRPRSRTPRRPTRRSGRPAIRSTFPRRCAARLRPTSSSSTT